jgi:hypothetical protein
MIGDGKDKFQLAEPAEVAKRKEVQDQGMRRRGERLKKDSNLTTKEKIEKAAQIKNLEGNSTRANSFSVLSVEDIINVSSDMGIVLDDKDFDTFDLLKQLECARNELFLKQADKNAQAQPETGEQQENKNDPLQLEWL